MSHRNPRSIWTGRVVFVLILAGVTTYLMVAGLDKADKLGSAGLLTGATGRDFTVTNSQGVQIGDHNTQHNTYGVPPK